MSWYFFGGFSAYAIVPSARVVNHSGCSVTQGWSGEHCSAMSSATSRPMPRGLGDEGVEVVEGARGRGGSRRARRRASRSRTGLPGSLGTGVRVLLRALAVPSCRSGGSGSGRRRRSPCRRSPAAAGPRCAACPTSTARSRGRSVAPSERGKISYHAPYSAQLALDDQRVCRRTGSRSRAAGARRARRAPRGSVPACSRACGGAVGVAQRRGRRPRAAGCWSAGRSTSLERRARARGRPPRA